MLCQKRNQKKMGLRKITSYGRLHYLTVSSVAAVLLAEKIRYGRETNGSKR